MATFNIVAGHSKKSVGASKYLDEVTEDRKIKKHLISLLKENGHNAYDCTSNAPTASATLTEQVNKCNKHEGTDVHIHFNAGSSDPDKKTTGVEVFCYSSASKAKVKATRIVNNIADLGFRNRGVKFSTSLYVLRKSKNPALLIEVCFVDDKDDAKLYNKIGAEKIAEEIAKGLLNVKVLKGSK